MAFLLIDFGASRVKTALSHNGVLRDIRSFSPAKPCFSERGYFEVAIEDILSLFQTILDEYDSLFEAILLCSEMHGFAVQHSDGSFATKYISWQDSRALEEVDGISTIEYMSSLFPNFREITGMKIKVGLPALNFLHLLRTASIQQGTYTMLSLPEVLGLSQAHITMTAGLGVWNIYSNTEYTELFSLYKSMGYTLQIHPVHTNIVVAGEYKGIPIYTGIGDNQCALYGANVQIQDTILNLGTGSQVAYIDEAKPTYAMEQRPYMNNTFLSTITHIPSGRALNCFLGFVQECFNYNNNTNPPSHIWDIFGTITLEDISISTLEFDLSIFSSAYTFVHGGAIMGIMEKEFTLKNYLASLLKSYLQQYRTIIEKFMLQERNILLAGGIPQKLAVIQHYYAQYYSTVYSVDENIDETLLGLNKIASQIYI